MEEKVRYLRAERQGFFSQILQYDGGRAFFAAPEALGEYVLVDFVNHHRSTKRIR